MLDEFMIQKIATEAEQEVTEIDDEQLLDWAAEEWAKADSLISPLRPTISQIRHYLEATVIGVVKDIATKYQDVSVITFALITSDLFDYLSLNMGWTYSPEYTIAVKLLVAAIYRRALKELGKRL